MVFVKVRETYDLHTVKNKMTVIAIHTPKPEIIKANFPGLLMQCKAYKPVSCDVRVACASTLPLDPLGVGVGEGDVAPEDLFNPILYKACSNFGMSQIEARIFAMGTGSYGANLDVDGNTAAVDVDNLTNLTDEFPIYYGFLSNAHEFRHANPQAGLEMINLRPLVYETLLNAGDNDNMTEAGGFTAGSVPSVSSPNESGSQANFAMKRIIGNSKPIPWINCTSYGGNPQPIGFKVPASAGSGDDWLANAEQIVPWINCVVGAIIIPPSRLHELFYRMVIEWTIEFSQIRPVSEITNWAGLTVMAGVTHYQNYDYETTKEAITGDKDTVFTSDQCMVSANVDVNKVM